MECWPDMVAIGNQAGHLVHRNMVMDFEWLNESPPSDWTQDGHKLMKQTFPLSVFKKKSAIVDDPTDSWKSKLDRWGNAQPRKYRHFASPPVERTPMVIIVCNKP